MGDAATPPAAPRRGERPARARARGVGIGAGAGTNAGSTAAAAGRAAAARATASSRRRAAAHARLASRRCRWTATALHCATATAGSSWDSPSRGRSGDRRTRHALRPHVLQLGPQRLALRLPLLDRGPQARRARPGGGSASAIAASAPSRAAAASARAASRSASSRARSRASVRGKHLSVGGATRRPSCSACSARWARRSASTSGSTTLPSPERRGPPLVVGRKVSGGMETCIEVVPRRGDPSGVA